jgi:TRAP transporter 4TM/12TM fusion protein
VVVLAAGTSVFHVFILSAYPIDPWFLRAWHFLLLSSVAFLTLPFGRGSPASRPSLPDACLILAGGAVMGYLILNFDELLYRVGVAPTGPDLLFATVAVLLVLEMTRRACGPTLPILALGFVLYSLVGPYLPGLLWHKGYHLKRVLSFVFSQEGIYGIPLGVSATFVFLFILFGAFLQVSGVGQFFLDLALGLAGGLRGGPAKVSVISSSLFGTVSGSAVANVVVDGVINIPLMKSSGFRPADAGAIEAVTSTGGQIMPPVMGAGAFLMAEFTGIPYPRIALAAAIPAILYYVSNFFVIDFQAAKLGLRGLRREALPRAGTAVRTRGHLLTPLLFMIIALMVFQYSPIRAALWAIAACVAVSWFRRETRVTGTRLVEALRDGALGAVDIAATCASAGIVIGVLSLTGLGIKLANIVVSYGRESLLLTLMLSMLVVIILGMGLPTTAAYAVSASVIAPALMKLGVPELPAHLFVFYFACISALTPPVAMAAYAAAAIAGASMWEVGWRASLYGAAGFIIPYMFVYGPALVLQAAWPEIVLAFATASVGCIALAGAVQGWLLGRAGLVERVALLAAALLLIKPGWVTDAIGLVLLGGVLGVQGLGRRVERSREARREVPS